MTQSPQFPTGNTLVPIIQDAIRANGGRIPLSDFMQLALYHPEHGYYLAESVRPGRSGDFLTSPEASPYFGLTIARQMVELWERLDEPSTWEIREYGAGTGVLAYDILAGISHERPAAAAALRYRLVELNPHRRAEAHAAMTEAGLIGQIEISSPDDPLPPFTGVLLANEVADAFPAHRLIVREGVLRELYVTNDGGGFDWSEGPLLESISAFSELSELADTLPDGSILDVSAAAASWFEAVCRPMERGLALVIDYGYRAPELFSSHRLDGTLRAYRGQTVSDNPFLDPGHYDLTTHVDFSALESAGNASGLQLAGFTTQADFLARLGMGMFLVDLQKEPDLTAEEYLAAKAAIIRLIDPGGLGRFGVLGMSRGIEVSPPLTGFAQ